MMKQSRNRIVQRAFGFLLVFSIFFSCTTPTEVSEINPHGQIVSLKNEILVFEDQDAFKEQIELNKMRPKEELLAWENELSFSSMLSFYHKGMAEEVKLFETLSPEDYEDKEIPHSDFVLSNSKYFPIDEDGMIMLNTYVAEVASVINKDGFVQVGKVLYQYSLNEMKSFVRKSDEGYTRADLDLITSSKESFSNDMTELLVAPVIRKRLTPDPEFGRDNFVGGCAAPDGFRRIQGSLWLTTTEFLGVQCLCGLCREPGCFSLFPEKNIFMEGQVRKFFGPFPAVGDLRIDGNYEVDPGGAILPQTTISFSLQGNAVTTYRGTILDFDTSLMDFEVIGANTNYKDSDGFGCSINF